MTVIKTTFPVKRQHSLCCAILLFTWVLCEYAEDRLHQVWDLIQPVQSPPRDFSLSRARTGAAGSQLSRDHTCHHRKPEHSREVFFFFVQRNTAKIALRSYCQRWLCEISIGRSLQRGARPTWGEQKPGLWEGWVQPVLSGARRKQIVPQISLQQTLLHLKKQHSPKLSVRPGQHSLCKGTACTFAFGWRPLRFTTLTCV